MSNSVNTVMAALGPDFDYLLSEAPGANLANNGSGGSLNLVPSTSNPWTGAPGVIRNSPWQTAAWFPPQSNQYLASAVNAPNLPNPATFTTGTFGVWFMLFTADVPSAVDWVPFAFMTRTTTSLVNTNSGRFYVNKSTGRINFNIGPDGAGNDWVRARSNTGVIVPGVPHLITATQRGDGNGIRLHLDGVDITNSQGMGSNATVNSFMDVLPASTPTLFVVNGVAGGTTASVSITQRGMGIIQRPFIFVNDPLSDSQIASLAEAGALTAIPQDYYEYCLDRFIETGDAFYWQPGYQNSSADRTEAANIDLANHDRMDASTPGTANLTETNRITNYTNYKMRFGGSTRYVATTSSADLNNDTVGTVNILLTLNSLVTTGQIAWAWAWGEGSAGDSENVGMYLGGTSLGTSIVLTIGRLSSSGATPGEFWRYVILPGQGAFGVGESLPIFTMITVTQDGTGIKVYRDGEELTGTPSNSGTTYDDEGWFEQLLSPSGAQPFVIGYPGGAATNNLGDNFSSAADFHDLMVLTRALTAIQVSELWDAVNGIFPPPSAPPDGGFSDTLDETGNEGDPNGPGPDWYWRCNETGAPLADTGIARLRAMPIDGSTIAVGGDPSFEAPGPLPLDETDAGIYLDGIGDYFEVGVNSVSGELVAAAGGTVGGFLARNSSGVNILYSQANDAGTAFWRFGTNADNQLELKVQSSAGNSVTVVGASVLNRAYHLIIATSDETNIRLWLDGVEEVVTITTEGTGADGDWFDAFTATRSALGALADSSFNVQLTGRLSETFIYDGDVLSAAQIVSLWQAAVRDGVTGSAASGGVISFEDVIFEDGQYADVLASNARASFLQILKFHNCQFVNGAEGSATFRPQLVRVEGNAQVQASGCRARVSFAPTFGRGGFVGSQINTATAATLYGSLLVVDCDLDGIGYVNGADFLAGVMAEAGFGLTAYSNRLRNANGAGIGWRADAQRVIVSKNLIGGVINALGGIYSGTGLNTGIGTDWLVRGNDVLDVAGTAAINLNGANLDASGLARNVLVEYNTLKDPTGIGVRVNGVGDFKVRQNQIDGPTEGVRLGTIQGIVQVGANRITGQTGTAIILAEATFQAAELAILKNFIDGESAGDGITVSGVRELTALGNMLNNLSIGVQIGNINLGAHIDANYIDATTPFAILAATTQVGLDIGVRNRFRTLGADAILTPDVDGAITKFAGYHPLTAESADNLDTINDTGRQGDVVVLRLAAGSSDITVRDGQDNIRLLGGVDFTMDAQSDQLALVLNADGDWHELSRQGT